MKYERYVMPESSSRCGDARYSGSKTRGMLKWRCASSIARLQFSWLVEKGEKFALKK